MLFSEKTSHIPIIQQNITDFLSDFVRCYYCEKTFVMIEFSQKGVTMIVSAISLSEGMYSSVPYGYNSQTEQIGDTSFNSLSSLKKIEKQNNLFQTYQNINEWKKFCHSRILGQKLNIIA